MTNLRMDPHSSRLLTHWSLCLEGYLKLDVDGSFLEGFGCFGVGGGVHNHDGDWIAGFSCFKVEGDVFG